MFSKKLINNPHFRHIILFDLSHHDNQYNKGRRFIIKILTRNQFFPQSFRFQTTYRLFAPLRQRILFRFRFTSGAAKRVKVYPVSSESHNRSCDVDRDSK